MQRDVMAASDDLQRVELQVLDRAHGLLGALDAAPAPPGPQALLAEDEATGCIDVDGQHDGLSGSSALGLSHPIRRGTYLLPQE